MESSFNLRPVLALGLIAIFLSSCSMDPGVRKQKYFEEGQNYFKKGQFSEAAIEFTNAVKIDPGFADAHFQLAESYLRIGQQGRAYQELVLTTELRPGDGRARMELATLLIQLRRFNDAQDQVNLLLKARPNDPGVHALASSMFAAQNKIPEAIAETQRSIALAPGLWESYLSLGLLQLKVGDQAAEASFKKVIELNPKAMQARLVLGSYYQSQKRLADAEKQFDEAQALDIAAIEPRKARAGLYLAEGRKSDAEQVLLDAKRDMPHNPDAILALSNFYFMTGELDKSVAEYRSLYQERPADLQVKKKYVQLLIQAKRLDDARRLTDEMLKINPKDDDALVYRSQLQISSGDLTDALQTLQVVVANAHDNLEAHYALGVALQKQGNLERAEGEWREVLRLDPNYLDAERSIADAAMLQGDMNTLEDAANQMIRLEPGTADGYALRALVNINRRRDTEAEADVRRAIAVAPQSAFGYVQLGNLRLAQKKYDEAAKAYQDALDRNARSMDALRGLVNAFVAEKQVDKAVAAVRAQIAKEPANSGFYGLLGALLFGSKRDSAGAQEALEKSIGLDSRNTDAVLQLCQVLAAQGEVDRAIATGEQALNTNGPQPGLYLVMGHLYELKADWPRAESAYQNALALTPQNPTAANELARAMLYGGRNSDLALPLAQTAVRGLPHSSGPVDTLGWIYYRKGVYPLALSYLQQALKLQEENRLPDNPDIHYHLGLVYEKTGQSSLARRHFEQVLKIDPGYRDAAEIRKYLAAQKT
ncbi:MAG: tetratricopeptide repeat protein [Terracidiphilus sp.]